MARTTPDPDLHLIVDGVRVDPSLTSGQAHVFRVQLPADELRLVSRAMRPADRGGGDTRMLGFAVCGLRLQQGGWSFDIQLSEPELEDGFHDFEPQGWRWTDGDACLPHAAFAAAAGSFLLIVFGWAADEYPLPEQGYAYDERLFLGFESLGEDCEFGFAQRAHRAEPTGLLRWATIAPATLQAYLDQRFDGLGEPANTALVWSEAEGEYKLQDRGSFSARTWVTERAADPEREAQIRRYGSMQIRLLRRKLLADMAHARKVFVFKTADPAFGAGERQRLFGAIRRIGPSSLLCVQPAGTGQRAGQVEDHGDGLFVGHVAPSDGTGSFHVWRALCRQARALHARRVRAGALRAVA